MGLSFGLWLVIAAAIQPAVFIVVSLVALRGSEPSDRPEILRALADVFRAIKRWSALPRRSTRSQKTGREINGVGAELVIHVMRPGNIRVSVLYRAKTRCTCDDLGFHSLHVSMA
jgi:hypothetical protein